MVEMRLALVDDHEMVRSALARVFESQTDLSVIVQAASAEDALARLEKTAVDVVVTDLALPGMSGRDLALLLLERNPRMGIVVVTYRLVPSEIQMLLEAGVRGYVPKSCPTEELLQAVRQVGRGQTYLASEASHALAESLRVSGNRKANPLSIRQTLILQHMAKGQTTKEIANTLCLSAKTVEKYRTEIFRRLNCRNLVEALEAGRRLSLLDR